MTRHVRAPGDELDAMFHAKHRDMVGLLDRMVRRIAAGQHVDAQRVALADLLAETMTVADMMGRRRLLLEADAHREDIPDELADRILFRDPAVTVPAVPFDEAIAEIIRREPRLAQSAEAVADIYRRRAGFALARATELKVTERVQKAINVLQRSGADSVTATKILTQLGADENGIPWTRAYSETVYRTNLNTAYTAGRMQQAKDENVRKVIGAFRLSSVRDSDVRRGRVPQDGGENHLAGDGLIAPTNHAIWEVAAPPHGYNCRCSLVLVSRFALKRKGLIGIDGRIDPWHPRGLQYFTSNFRPHSNFASRPDAGLYG